MHSFLFYSMYFPLLLFSITGQAQQFPNTPTAILGTINTDKTHFQYFPTLKIGSHVNEMAYTFSPFWIRSTTDYRHIQLRLKTTLRANLSYMGIEGKSVGMVNQFMLTYSRGEKVEAFTNDFLYGNLRKNNFSYYYIHYASTDRTHQFSGGIHYTRLFTKSLVTFVFENDFWAFLGLDEFRTGGVSLDYKWLHREKLLGVGVGVLLWTGSTKGLPNLNFGQEYNMNGQHGAEYSHGILSARFHYQQFSLAVGYDADGIRRKTQDFVHRLINDGTIPVGTLSENVFFIQLNVYAFDSMY